MGQHSQYLFQVVPLFLQCQENLKRTISRIHFSPGRYESLWRLQRSLVATEELLRAYVFQILRGKEREHRGRVRGEESASANPMLDGRRGKHPGDILRALDYLKRIASREASNNDSHTNTNPRDATTIHRGRLYYTLPRQSAESQLLFRLVVVFQLLLVRIDDAHYVITGHRIEVKGGDNDEDKDKFDCGDAAIQRVVPASPRKGRQKCSAPKSIWLPSLGICGLGAGLIAGVLGRKHAGRSLQNMRFSFASTTNFVFNSSVNSNVNSNRTALQLLSATAKLGVSVLGFAMVKGFITVCWMTDKIIRSNSELLDWNHQWELIDGSRHYSSSAVPSPSHFPSPLPLPSPSFGPKPPTTVSSLANESPPRDDASIAIDRSMDEKSRKLIEYARKHGRKSYFWLSTGEIRFLMVKRFMDIYYASVGAGVHCTNLNEHPNNAVFLPLVAGAVASFYAITGAPTPTVGENDASSRDLIQHAWGMVSLPVLKDLMLQASRLVKGAAVADRIVLCGVPCFILSKDPAPELAALLQRQGMGDSVSSSNLSRLPTIAETESFAVDDHESLGVEEDETETSASEHQPFVRSRRRTRKSFVGSKGQYRQRDVILHLTGGGFFAHTIASDLPYLLDWSSSTGSVVICPEYSLLPEHQFPTQLNQISAIYAALASGNTGAELGFDANSIIVTGESAGGNLAAALCVQLALHNIQAERKIENNHDGDYANADAHADDGDINIDDGDDGGKREHLPCDLLLEPPNSNSRMPDAIMLSCPALNLTTELSHSRVVGTEDPVLPNALISAISEAYLPRGSGFDNRHSLVSPCCAPDAVLRRFPPTLLFASSKDPLLDDSVTFNERLKEVGVDSELVAVRNVPHAYLGLGTAGFPEAVQVQQYAMDWLSSKFSG